MDALGTCKGTVSRGRRPNGEGNVLFVGFREAPLERQRLASMDGRTVQRFVETESFYDAVKKLDQGVIILIGTRHTGRRTGAMRLMSTPAATHLEEFIADWDEADARRLSVDPGGRYLLDLSDTPRVPEAFGRALASRARNYAAQSTLLVVLATPENWAECRNGTSSLTVDWVGPAAREVARKLLETAPDIPSRSDWLTHPGIADLLTSTAKPADGRPNTVLAVAYDLKVFFTAVDRPVEQVRPADVLGFITGQRADSGGGRRLRPTSVHMTSDLDGGEFCGASHAQLSVTH
jgi:hypothetical protein